MQEQCAPLSLGELFDAYMDNHARLHCRRWRDLERAFTRYLSGWTTRPAESIKRFDVQQLHSQLGRDVGSTTANRVVQLLRTIYNKGRLWELISCSNPAIGITMFRLEARERFLSEEEVAQFFTALNSLRYEATRDFLMLCLLTAARRSNVAAMKWADVDLTRGVWYISGKESKNRQSYYVPLVGLAVQILQRRKDRAQSEWVFPSTRSETGHLTKPEKAWRVLIERAGLNDVRIHDLRRTLASYQAMTGANMLIIAKTLNHKDMKSVQIYGRLQIDPVRHAMERALSAMVVRTSP